MKIISACIRRNSADSISPSNRGLIERNEVTRGWQIVSVCCFKILCCRLKNILITLKLKYYKDACLKQATVHSVAWSFGSLTKGSRARWNINVPVLRLVNTGSILG